MGEAGPVRVVFVGVSRPGPSPNWQSGGQSGAGSARGANQGTVGNWPASPTPVSVEEGAMGARSALSRGYGMLGGPQ